MTYDVIYTQALNVLSIYLHIPPKTTTLNVGVNTTVNTLTVWVATLGSGKQAAVC